MARPNLVITGFMGTGKTSVAKQAAERLGLDFTDMDAILEERLGMSISQVFQELGEARFRREEARLVQELARADDLAIATGGGALLRDASREAFLSRGAVLVCLDCQAEELAERLARVQDRPLLEVSDRAKRIQQLITQRQAAYGRIPHHLDTTHLTVEEAAREAMALYQGETGAFPGETIPVRTPFGSYNIYLGRGMLSHAGEIFRGLGLGPRVVIVTNPEIPHKYSEMIVTSLAERGFQPRVLHIPGGEVAKTLDTVRTLYDEMLAAGLDRTSTVLALGGGVVGDVAGFAAATFMRGIALIQVPTTVLGMVDSSVGGKVGVDLPQGKNLIGAFKEPVAVLADPDVLTTLPEEEFRSGLAEVVKHALLASPVLFEHLERRGIEDMDWILSQAIQVKIEVVEEDPYEQGRRVILNLGHTFAHALEAVSNFSLRHGEAVAVGLLAAARVSARMGLCDSSLPGRIVALLTKLRLPTGYPHSEPEEVLAAMSVDKKAKAGRLRFVLLREVGQAVISDQVPEEILREEVARLCQSKPNSER